MQLKYKCYDGGSYNPFKREAEDAYRKLTEERKIADGSNKEPTEKVFPTLPSWPQYVIAESRSTFWQMERAIGENASEKAGDIETIWKEAVGQKKVSKWLHDVEGDETEKAMCYYMELLHRRFIPNDISVDFRLYFSEGGHAKRIDLNDGFSLTPYEG